MNNTNKRMTSVLAAAMAFGTIAPAVAPMMSVMAAPTDYFSGQTIESYNGYYFSTPVLSDTGVVGQYSYTTTIVGQDLPKNASNVTIPATIKLPAPTTTNENASESVTCVVKGIEANAFAGNTTVKNLTINSNIDFIDGSAFANTGLQKLTVVGNGETTIGEDAFAYCGDLTSIKLSGVKTIGKRAFTWAGDNALVQSDAQIALTLDGVVNIGESAFENAKGLFNVELPDSLKVIGENAFYGTSINGDIQLPEKLVEVGGGAFATSNANAKNPLTIWLDADAAKYMKNWTADVFDGSGNTDRFEIVGYTTTAPNYIAGTPNEKYYIGIPSVILTGVSTNSNVTLTDPDGNPLVADNKNIQVPLGSSVEVSLPNKGAGKLLVDGKVVKTWDNVTAPASKSYKVVTPQVGNHTVEYVDANGRSSKVLTIVVVSSTANYWTDENIVVPEWHAGQNVEPTGAKAYQGTVYYVYSDAEEGTYTKTKPSTPGIYWVKAMVDATTSYLGLESKPKQFEVLPALPAEGWKNENGNWYYYVKGEALTGLQTIENNKFLFDKNGVMQTGWYESEDGWMYFVSGYGNAKKGWLNLNGTWYLMNDNYIMESDKWVTDKGLQYHLSSSGAMDTSKWIKDGSNWKYVDRYGVMKKNGWLNSNGNWYYFNKDGNMLTSGTVDGWTIGSNGIATPGK